MTQPAPPEAPPVPPARMYLESPRHGDYHVDGLLVGHGWVLSPAGARSAVVEIGGQVVAEATLAADRPDVAKALPGRGLAQGFRFEFDPSPWRGRLVSVRVRVVLEDGTSLAQSARVLVSRKPRPGWLGFVVSRLICSCVAPPGQVWQLLWRAARHLLRDFRQARMTGRVDRHLLPAQGKPVPPQPRWAPSDPERRALRERAARLGTRPAFSVLVRHRGAAEAARTMSSLEDQALAPREVLAVEPGADGGCASAQARLEQARGEFVVFVDAGDVLPAHALLGLAEVLAHGAWDAVYSDECRLDGDVLRDPFFKPDWSPALLLAQPYCLRLCAWRRELLRSAGGVRASAAAAWELDLALRATASPGVRIAHAPEVLVYRSGPPERATLVSAAVVAEAANGRGLRADVAPAADGRCHSLRLSPARGEAITAVIPTRDRLSLLRPCVDSLRQRTVYPGLQVLVVDNGSQEPETLAWLAHAERTGQVRVLRDGQPFNYSALNNAAVRACTTPLVLLLNNDVCAMQPEWLGEMAALLEQPDVVAVGACLLYGDDTIQHAGVTLGIGRVGAHGHKRFPKDDPGYHGLLLSLREVSAATAACLLVRRESFLAAGGFDEDLAVAFNDVDLCLRLRAAGGRILWTPRAVLRHYESVSRGIDKRGHARFEREVLRMQEKWGDALRRDPYHNPRLSLRATDYRPEDERWAAP